MPDTTLLRVKAVGAPTHQTQLTHWGRLWRRASAAACLINNRKGNPQGAQEAHYRLWPVFPVFFSALQPIPCWPSSAMQRLRLRTTCLGRVFSCRVTRRGLGWYFRPLGYRRIQGGVIVSRQSERLCSPLPISIQGRTSTVWGGRLYLVICLA